MLSREILNIVRSISHLDARERENGADQVTDLLGSYTPNEVTMLTVVLAASAAEETNTQALEAELHAIIELTSTGYVTPSMLSGLKALDAGKLTDGLAEYVADLLDLE